LRGKTRNTDGPSIGAFDGPETPKNVQVKGPAWAGWRNEDQEISCNFIAIDKKLLRCRWVL